MGAACVWQTPGPNKEVFDAEAYAIYRALRALGQKQEGGHRYTVFVDSTATTDRTRTDAQGPSQRPAIATIEARSRTLERGNNVTILRVPLRHRVPGNEKADEYR